LFAATWLLKQKTNGIKIKSKHECNVALVAKITKVGEFFTRLNNENNMALDSALIIIEDKNIILDL
jgi:hypothetical protein